MKKTPGFFINLLCFNAFWLFNSPYILLTCFLVILVKAVAMLIEAMKAEEQPLENEQNRFKATAVLFAWQLAAVLLILCDCYVLYAKKSVLIQYIKE